jgi:hypothetical protein
MRSRTGKDRRAEGWQELEDSEIRQVRAFDWTKMLIPHAPLLLKIIPLLTIGGVAGYQAPKVIERLNGGPPPIAPGETVVPEELPPELKQSLDSLNAAISKLQKRASALEGQSKRDDTALDERIQRLEGEH